MCEVVGVGRMVLHVTKCLEHDCQKIQCTARSYVSARSCVMSAIYLPARLPLIPCSACASCRVTWSSLAGLPGRHRCRAMQCSDSSSGNRLNTWRTRQSGLCSGSLVWQAVHVLFLFPFRPFAARMAVYTP